MAAQADILGRHHGEAVEFTFYALNRDGTALTSAASATVTMKVNTPSNKTTKATFSTDDGQIVLNDAGTAEFIVTITASDMSDLTAGRMYHHHIETDDGTNDPILQVHGKFKLQK